MRIPLGIVFSAVLTFGGSDTLNGSGNESGDTRPKESYEKSPNKETETQTETQIETWLSVSKLAGEREKLGQLSEAEVLRRRAVELGERQFGANDKRIASLLTNLGTVLHARERDAEADPLLRRALVIAEASSGTSEDKRLIASVLNALGLTLYGQHEFARAEPVLRRALVLFEQSEGRDSLVAGKVANNLATVYSDSHQYPKAEAEMSRALTIYEAHLSGEDPMLAQALANMFTILCEQKRAAEGEPYLRRALAIGEKVFPGTARMAKIEGGLAAFEAQRGNYHESARILEHVIAVEEKTLGPTSPQLGRSLSNYSAVLRRLHQTADAKRAEARANFILKSFY